jgi:hypothetical protein
MKNLGSLSTMTKSLRYGAQLRPVRDWLVLLALFVLALFGSLVWNLWLFAEVTQGEQIGNASSTPPVEIKLDQVTKLFQDRADERARYTGEYRFVDPSL